MSTILNFGRDSQGYNAFAPQPSTNLYSATIPAASGASITVPTNKPNWIVGFSFQPGADVWVSYSTSGASSASPPAGATFASTDSELNPSARIIPSTVTTSSGTNPTTIYFFNNGTGTADVGVSLYASS